MSGNNALMTQIASDEKAQLDETRKQPWKRTKWSGTRRQQWLLFGIAAVPIIVFFLALFGAFNWRVAGFAALGLIFIGAGCRVAAHGQKNSGWVFVDGIGKVLAYYSAMIALFAAWVA